MDVLQSLMKKTYRGLRYRYDCRQNHKQGIVSIVNRRKSKNGYRGNSGSLKETLEQRFSITLVMGEICWA